MKKTQKTRFFKKSLQIFFEIGKIHVVYVYIKNQKQTDELQRSQLGCGLGKVCTCPLTPGPGTVTSKNRNFYKHFECILTCFTHQATFFISEFRNVLDF